MILYLNSRADYKRYHKNIKIEFKYIGIQFKLIQSEN